MKKHLTLFTITIIIFCAISVIKHENTYAVNYISGASVNGHVGQPGHTKFKVNLHFSSNCSGEDIKCDQVDGKFPCIEHGDDYTSSICSNKEWAHSGNPQSDGWDYYEVVLYPCDSDEQNMQGTYRVRHRYTLTLKSIDESGQSLAGVTGLGDKKDKAWSGNKASVTRGYTNTGYTFVGFSDGTQGNTYTKELNDNLTVYAVYKGEGATSSIDINVNNNSAATKYHKFSKLVYAKPGDINGSKGDKVTFSASYSPLAQGGTAYYPQRVKIDNDSECGGNNTTLTLNKLFNNCRNGRYNWNNVFSVTKSDSFKSDKDPIDYTNLSIGSTSKASKTNTHEVLPQEEGSELTEHAVTNRTHLSSLESTPKEYSIGLASNGVSLGNVSTEALDASATVRVPYNFKNIPNKPGQPGVPPNPSTPGDDPDEPKDGNGEEKIVYAGEEDKFQFTIDVNPRQNPETNGNYATIVRDAKWRLGLCIGGQCNGNPTYNYTKEEKGNLNDQFKIEGVNGENGIKKLMPINIPDIKAGSRICVVAEVYPATSGSYLNWNDTQGDGKWARSPRSCYIVAKRPSTQIWGGNVFTQGKIETSTAIKNNLNGYTAYDPTDKKGTFVFGSWNELGVITNNSIKGFGSGASMGYAGNDGLQGNILSTWPMYRFENGGETARYTGRGNLPNYNGRKPGGSDKKDYCDRVPLTIPNTNCQNGGIVGSTTSMQSLSNAFDDKQSLVDILGGNAQNVANGASINQGTIGALGGGETKLVQSGGDIIIAGDLIYFDNISEYQSYRDIPKLVIYAENIKINCNVERIDALLIAKKAVLTCNNLGNINLSDKAQVESAIKATENNEANSRQLLINGAIIANKLIANRTYGAATGANSIISAEVINFDPTLYKFGVNAEDDEDVAGRFDMSDVQEISPRL